MGDFKIAVLITCFNRKAITIKCLYKLFSIYKDVEVFLVDDNSTDGTYEAVSNLFPKVHLLRGSGNLFWNRGMNYAWKEAAKNNFDFYLWLNDDVFLYPNFLKELFECYKLTGDNSIVSGLIENPDRTKIIYGGANKSKELIHANGKIQDITFLNGNVVLVPRCVFMILGNLDPYFHHDIGDVDYGLRALKNNIKVVSTRVPIGEGKENFIIRIRMPKTSLPKRFKKLYSPLGSNPNISFYFKKRHFGYFNAFVFYLFVIFINILSDSLVKLIFGDKYLKH